MRYIPARNPTISTYAREALIDIGQAAMDDDERALIQRLADAHSGGVLLV